MADLRRRREEGGVLTPLGADCSRAVLVMVMISAIVTSRSSCILFLATFGKVSGKYLQGKALGLVEGRTRSLVTGFGVEGSCVYI